MGDTDKDDLAEEAQVKVCGVMAVMIINNYCSLKVLLFRGFFGRCFEGFLGLLQTDEF